MSNFDYTIVEMIENASRNIKLQPLYLGGTPGGIVGQLDQRNVLYDSTEAEMSGFISASGATSLLDNMNHIRYRIKTLEDNSSGPVSGYMDKDVYDSDDNGIIDQFDATMEPTGFPALADSDVNYNHTTKKVTISPTAGYFTYWHKGKLYTKNAAEDVSINVSFNGMFYIYYDGPTLTISEAPWNLSTHCPVATLYYNGLGGLLSDERHGISMSWGTQVSSLETDGVKYGYGLSCDFGNSTFTVYSGYIYNADMRVDIDTTTECLVLNRFGVGGAYWDWAGPQATYFKESGGVLQYDSNGTPTNVTDNYYVAMWLFATNDFDNPIYAVVGQRQDSTLQAARDNNKYESLNLITRPSLCMKLLARAIIKRSGTSEVFQEFQDYRMADTSSLNNAVVRDHGTLTGLGDPDHPASAILTSTTNFNNLLSATEDTVQKALDKLDNLIIPSGNGGVDVKNSGALIGHRAGINFIPGTNISLVMADVPGSDHVNVTITSSGGGTLPTLDRKSVV